MNTIFQRTEFSEPTLFSPSNTMKKMDDFPEICVSTFSENFLQKFSSLNITEKITELYTANGIIQNISKSLIAKVNSSARITATGFKKLPIFP
ncbi:hypothetical protein [Lacrimispora sp. 210928-DFI.3.58]|uniref:hypothetical protein n=1 Tax=Lacrimispora sp. 210928-DFI.3.58 TaxID=2883214 RepID=UPI001D0723E0|nr:hypothetical protein [Lacrimispora sp. 210928-DFI.3.58]MCB7319666.1 hypothetical protein [Lacrimispora sp. 210928-DFI.3.58]